MNIAELISEHIKREYQEGKSQKELAEKYGVAQPYIQRLLSGQRNAGGISLNTLMKMFPNATINLNGDKIVGNQTNNGTNNGVIGINHGTVGANCLSHMIDKVLTTDDLTAEEKVKVIKVLKQ